MSIDTGAAEVFRGTAIQARFEALGISDRDFHERTGITRQTLRRAVDADEKVRPSTYGAIEVALETLEGRKGTELGALLRQRHVALGLTSRRS